MKGKLRGIRMPSLCVCTLPREKCIDRQNHGARACVTTYRSDLYPTLSFNEMCSFHTNMNPFEVELCGIHFKHDL